MFSASICSRSRAKVNEQEQIEFILFHLVPPAKRIVCNCCIAPSPVRRIEPRIRCCIAPPVSYGHVLRSFVRLQLPRNVSPKVQPECCCIASIPRPNPQPRPGFTLKARDNHAFHPLTASIVLSRQQGRWVETAYASRGRWMAREVEGTRPPCR